MGKYPVAHNKSVEIKWIISRTIYLEGPTNGRPYLTFQMQNAPRESLFYAAVTCSDMSVCRGKASNIYVTVKIIQSTKNIYVHCLNSACGYISSF